MADTVDLGTKLETYVDGLVKSGRFETRNDALKEGVRLLEERETRLARLDEALAKGLADSAASRVAPVDDVGARLKRKYTAMLDDGGA